MKEALIHPSIVLATTALAGAIAVGVLFWRQRNGKKYQNLHLDEMVIPSKWTKVGEVGELIIYPLKGGKRKCLNEAQFTNIGLQEISPEISNKLPLQDRVFIVFNDKHEFMNIKRHPKMLKIETAAVDDTRVKFSYPGVADLFVKIPDNNNNNMNELNFYYGEKVKAVDCGDEAAAWFSQVLKEQPSGMRLGCFVQSLVPPRTINGSYKEQLKVYPKLHDGYLGAFADIASYMLMGEESLKDLNTRLNKPVSEHNFRPNILVKDSPAFSEDKWDWVRIGDNVILRGFKYCTRCVVTTIDADTAERDPSIEPLKTLKTYRQVREPELQKVEGDSPVMGMYLGCHRTGSVKLGDPVYIA